MLHRVRCFLQEDKEYFNSNRADITRNNNQMLMNGSIVYAFVLIFYTVVTMLTAQPLLLRNMYFIFDGIHFCFCIAVSRRNKQIRRDYWATQCFSALLEISILGFFALEGAFASRTQHSLYIPIALLLILLLFTHQTLYTNIITLLYVVSYAVMSFFYKTQDAFINDLYIAMATFLSANIGYVMIAKMRHKEGAALLRYEALSKIDQLTGLYNKITIESICQRILSDPDRRCTFIILDLDNFKHVNDVYGHDVGDEVLRLVSGELQTNFRVTDFIGRFGGDEFVVLMDGCEDMEIVKERVERVIAQIRKLQFSKEGLSVQCSSGITMRLAADSPKTMFKRADKALYEVKAHNKGNYLIR